jgi:hypothetical protein
MSSGHGAQGVGQLSRKEQGFDNLLLPKSDLNTDASLPSTSGSQSKLPSHGDCATAANGTNPTSAGSMSLKNFFGVGGAQVFDYVQGQFPY